MLYVATNLATALGEVFGDLSIAEICPNYRVAIVGPRSPIDLLDLRGQGAAMRIGALPSLATGAYARDLTQQWARAIHEDQPAPNRTVHGVYYNAAHSNGPALALWDTDSMVETLHSGSAPQDFALSDPPLWPRIVHAAGTISLAVATVSACASC